MSEFSLNERKWMLKELYRNRSKLRVLYNSSALYFVNFSKLFARILCGNTLFVEHFEFVITTHCSLNCKNCSNLMPVYRENKTAQHFDLDSLVSQIDAFTKVVDYTFNCRILGGEPLLHPEFSKVLSYVLKKKNIGEVHIVTNGTLLINNEDVLRLLQNERVIVWFSDYGELSKNKKANIECFEQRGIRYNVSYSENWLSFGDIKKRNSDKSMLKEQYKKCMFACKTYMKGNWYHCPRSAMGTDLGYFDYKDEFVTLDNNDDRKITRRKIIDLLCHKDYLECCDYCLAGTDDMIPISVAEQK